MPSLSNKKKLGLLGFRSLSVSCCASYFNSFVLQFFFNHTLPSGMCVCRKYCVTINPHYNVFDAQKLTLKCLKEVTIMHNDAHIKKPNDIDTVSCNILFNTPFNNMQTLKFKARLTNAIFATINQMFSGSSQLLTMLSEL